MVKYSGVSASEVGCSAVGLEHWSGVGSSFDTQHTDLGYSVQDQLVCLA